MKKEEKRIFKNVFLKILPILLLFLTTAVNATTNKDLLTPRDAFNTVVYNANEWDLFKSRTKEEIGAKYDSVKITGPTYIDKDRTTYYDVAPIAPLEATGEGVYYEGRVTQDTINVMTAEANYYRWLMGYSELRRVGTNSVQLQKEALARRYNMAHDLNEKNRPYDFPIEQWNETKTYTHNILAWGYSPRGAISGWISEGYDPEKGTFESNSSIGHRVAIIDPTVVNLDFGFVGEEKEGPIMSQEEAFGEVAIGKMYSDNSANNTVAFGAFPVPGYMPMNNIKVEESTWSVALNPSIIKVTNPSSVIVKVTNLLDGSSYECTTSKGNLEYIANKYPVPYLNYFQPQYKYGDKYKIEVTGLTDTATNAPAKIEYVTELFNINDYTEANVKSVSTNTNYTTISVSNNNSSIEKLNEIAKLLPKKVKVNTDTGRDTELNVLGEWTVDEENVKFVNKVDKTNLPSYILDPNNILDSEVSINYNIATGGTLKVSNINPDEGTNVTFDIRKYYTNNVEYKIYQIKDNKVNIIAEENSVAGESTYKYTIDNIKGKDSGIYIAGYKLYSILYIVGIEDINVNVKEPEKEDPEYVVPIGLTANYKDTLSSITLPDGFTWKDETMSVGDAGENEFYVTYTPEDTEQYNIVENIKVKVIVKKINPEYTIPTGLTATYNDKLNTITLPDGFTWNDETESVGNVGTNKFIATYTPEDTKNYNTIKNIEVNVSVSEKKLAIPTLDKTSLTYNFKEQEVKVNNIDSNLMTSSGTTKATNANTYNVIVALKDKNNYIWENSSNDDVTLTWNINKLPKVTVNITGKTLNVIYDGEEKNVEGYTYESSNSSYTDKYFTFTGNKTATGTAIGKYNMGLTPSNFTNTNNNIETVEFKVIDGYLNISDKHHLNISGLTYNSKVYDGTKVTPTGSLKVERDNVPVSDLEIHFYKKVNDNYIEVSENETNKAGAYRVEYKIPNTNNMYSGNVIYDYEIKRKTINKPTLVNSSYTYNKQEQEVKLNNFDENLMTVTGATKGIDANTYNLLISLNDKENYSWSNNTNNDLTLSWTINKSSNIKVFIHGNTKKVIYDGEEKNLDGYTYTSSSEIYTKDDFKFTGNSSVSGIDLGTYPMNLNKTDFKNINNNFENVEFIITDGYLEICEKEVLEITGLVYSDKAYTGLEYIPDGDLIITDNKLGKEDLEVIYEGIGETIYSSSTPPIKVGTYKVTYQVPSDNELYTGSKTYTFKISKANPVYEKPTDLVAERNMELASIELPDGFAWKQNEVLTPGFNKYIATYTPSDIENYNVVDNIEIDVIVMDYRIEEDLEYIIGVNKKLSFNIKAANVNIESILINEKELSEEYYIVEDKTITISEEYIDKLKLGSYTIEVVLDDGEKISKQFIKREQIILEEMTNPNTNDNIINSIYLILISLLVIISTKIKLKKYN